MSNTDFRSNSMHSIQPQKTSKTSTHSTELDLLQRADHVFKLESSVHALQTNLDVLSRKLAKMTDENWAKDLELKELRQAQTEKDTTIARLNEECAIHTRNLRDLIERFGPLEANAEESARALRQAKSEAAQEIEHLKDTTSALKQQVHQLLADRTRLQSELDRTRKERDQQNLHSQRLLEEARAQQSLSIQKLDTSSAEIIRLQKALNEQAAMASEMRRSFESEQAVREQQEERGRTLDQQVQSLIETNSMQSSKLGELEALIAEQSSQLDQARDVVDAFEKALESSRTTFEDSQIRAAQSLREINQQHSQRIEGLLNQQNQLNCEIASLRAKCSTLERRMHEASEMADRSRAEKMQFEIESQRHISKRETEFQTRLDEVFAENDQLRRMVESQQGVRQAADNIMREKGELIRLAKHFVSEMQMVRATHPLKDYLGMTDLELSKIQSHLKNTPAQTPERARLEDLTVKMLKKREFLNSVLANSQKQLEDRAQSVLKSFDSPQQASQEIRPENHH